MQPSSASHRQLRPRSLMPTRKKEFHFEDFPALKKEMEALMQDLGSSLQANIEDGDQGSWTLFQHQERRNGGLHHRQEAPPEKGGAALEAPTPGGFRRIHRTQGSRNESQPQGLESHPAVQERNGARPAIGHGRRKECCRSEP